MSVDLIGPIKPISEKGDSYVLTIADFATRYPEAVPLKSIATEIVAEALMGIYSRVGVPDEILSDRGAQFSSSLMKVVVVVVVVVNHCFTSLFGTKDLLSDNVIR